jgi:hypothetical protein
LFTISSFFWKWQLANIFPQTKGFIIHFDKKNVGQQFGQFFHILIWSPCSECRMTSFYPYIRMTTNKAWRHQLEKPYSSKMNKTT